MHIGYRNGNYKIAAILRLRGDREYGRENGFNFRNG